MPERPTRLLCVAFAAAFLLAPRAARADLTNDAAIDAHADAVVAGLDLRTLGAAQKQALLPSRLALSLGALVPILGSYELDTRVYGEVRPAAILFDWVLGGILPAGLAVTALATRGRLSPGSRAALGWTALGLYGVTRVGVIVIGNLHISEYDRRVSLRLGLAAAGPAGATLTAAATW